jgi:hypothetical protein
MKTLLYISTLLILMSCGHKTNNSTADLKTNVNDSIIKTSNLTENKIEFNKYFVDGIFLKGRIRLFDNEQKTKGKLVVDKITNVQILEKSSKMYNLDGNTDDCEKAYFLKVKYQGKDYTVFGQDVYEINNLQKFSAENEKNEKLTLFPITNLKMGVGYEGNFTGCNDYSLLVLQYGNKQHYSLLKYPNNDDTRGKAVGKFAILFHDDMSEAKIYKTTINQDTLIIGIKEIYQEGGSIYNMKANLSGELPETIISDRISFETDEELRKMDEFK